MKNNMFTPPQQTLTEHVQLGENKLRPTAIDANRGNTLIQQKYLLVFVCAV